jgi:serine/threonine protein kinase
MKEDKKNYLSSPSTESFSKEKVNDPYFSPYGTSIKIIDFGAATREHEKHSEIINTRQYRAPEVILGSSIWDEKSDIWGLGCIFAELYTGELLFQTHENKLHICQLEKISGI